jgi:hypothetical protein
MYSTTDFIANLMDRNASVKDTPESYVRKIRGNINGDKLRETERIQIEGNEHMGTVDRP